MEETAVVSMEFVLVALIALAVLLGIVWYVAASRTREFDRRMAALEEENARLRSAFEKACQADTKPTASVQPNRQEEAVPTDAAAGAVPVQHPIVPIGTRHPAVVPARPVAVIPQHEAAGKLSPEIVAVIMAAIAACGYSPAAIRSIRPVQRHSQNWIMAGRLVNMKK